MGAKQIDLFFKGKSKIAYRLAGKTIRQFAILGEQLPKSGSPRIANTVAKNNISSRIMEGYQKWYLVKVSEISPVAIRTGRMFALTVVLAKQKLI